MGEPVKAGFAAPETYINRELSWLHFARRVLELAEDPLAPLLERVKFVGIMGMIYDEFAMKRIGGLRRRIEKKSKRLSPEGLTASGELQVARAELKRQTKILCRLLRDDLRPALTAAGIPLLDYDELSKAQRAEVDDYFTTAVEPILTPLAVDAGHPFPFISNLSLNLAVTLHRRGKKRSRFVRIKVPPNRPRWVPVSLGGEQVCGYIPLEQLIAHNLERLFPGCERMEFHYFRLTRGAKDDPWSRLGKEEEGEELAPGSLIGMVSSELTARKFAGVSRLQVSAEMPKQLRQWPAGQLQVEADDVVTMDGPMALTDLVSFQPDGFEELRDRPYEPITHPRLRDLESGDTGGIFRQIAAGDILLHHPYHDYETSILAFLQSAARDPQVLAIKLTIYRTSRQSPIIEALTEAARRGKQVAVLVEITARFDEAPNIAWGEQLERAGAHVAYGMERIKTHVKVALVVREEEGDVRRYMHLSTGNYHAGTARLYEDLSILTCREELGVPVAAVFNELISSMPAPDYHPLLVAPHNLRERFTELIRREGEHARAGRPSGIRAKMNQLQDAKIINELYEASQAGVPITLNVRGLCCLRAGVPDVSPTIRVYSTLGRFLEHGRLYRFENGGEPEYFIRSADWMRRNLDSRMETVAPVLEASIQSELDQVLATYESDNCSAWDMQADGSYLRRRPEQGEADRAAQEVFMGRAGGAGAEQGLAAG